MNKLIVILGPTASGKTRLAVNLASKYSGEIISADSRQIYKGMDIGTGKDLNEYHINNDNIPYHLINIINPQQDYSVFKFKQDCNTALYTIESKNKVPILCGGTGLYIESILLDYKMPKTKPNLNLRKKLDNKSLDQLKNKLLLLDRNSFNEEYHISKRRMIRSIEIIKDKNNIAMKQEGKNILDKSIVLGINMERPVILSKIKERLHERLEEGMIEEVQLLLNSGISYERLAYFGLEYKFVGKYLSKNINYDEMKQLLNNAINKFSKRQMTFFRRMEKRGIKIHWINSNNIHEIYSLINNFLPGTL
tara:strand:+ start:1274 stop:2194 length:921 start_codon:yes stop_codon:yes gene_type:complete